MGDAMQQKESPQPALPTSIPIRNFKSHQEVTLPLAPLALLIGANASGKSNAVEALRLLQQVKAALDGKSPFVPLDMRAGTNCGNGWNVFRMNTPRRGARRPCCRRTVAEGKATALPL